MTARILRIVLLTALISSLTGPLIGSGGSSVRPPGPTGVWSNGPRPCLVPPVPLKKERPPRLGQAPRTAEPPGRVRPPRLRLRGAGATEPDVRKVLALRVDFEDQPMDSSAAYFERLLFFLDQYYDQVSGGQARFASTLNPTVYRLPRPTAWYGLDDSVGTRQAVFAYDAVKAADPDVDYSLYDHVVVFHGGPGQESDVKDDSREQIWSASFRLVDFAYYNPWPGAEQGIATDDTTAAGDTLFIASVGMFPETESQDGYVFGCLGVLCHEMGHALDLPDLYDTVAPEGEYYVESQGVGNWDLMASGTWNNNGFVPGEPSAWTKVFLGWVEPVVMTADGEVSLKAVELDRRHGVVKIPLNADEYFLIENRFQDPNGDGIFNYQVADSSATCGAPGPGGSATSGCRFDFYHDSYIGSEWDFYLPGDGAGSGLLIWHIDDSVIYQQMEYNTVNADPLHKGVDLEEADGIQDLDTQAGDMDGFGSRWDSFREGWVDRFAPDTEPNSDGYYGIPSHVTVDRISAPDSVMTFRVTIGGRDRNWPVATAGAIGGNHVAVADLDGDTGIETAVADRAGNLYVLDPDGSPAWTGGAGGAFVNLGTPVGSPLLADVDGDGLNDLLVMSDDGRVFGFGGGTGRPLGSSEDGFLLTSPNPMPGVQLWAFDVEPGVPGVWFGFGGAADTTGSSRLQVYSVTADRRVLQRGVTSLHNGTGELPSVILDLNGIPDDRHVEILSPVRRGAGEALRGSLEIQNFDGMIGGGYHGGNESIAPLPDTLFYSAPVVGDLDRDGRLDVVVTASNLAGVDAWDARRVSFIYALSLSIDDLGIPGMTVLPGWPRRIEDEYGMAAVSGDDALSLADIDGNGYPEVLLLGTHEVLRVLNYHGESLLSLPEEMKAELRYYVEPQLAPLVADLSGDGRPEIVLPLRDGQVFAVNPDGSRHGTWNWFGGGATRSSPAVADLDGDGRIELVTAADFPGGGKIMARTIGSGTAAPVWGMVRRGAAFDGTLPAEGQTPVVNGPTLADVFMMPNPARSQARIHYRVGAGATGVTVDIVDLMGRGVRRLEGTSFPGSDNTVSWDLKDADGSPVAPGVYLARIEVRTGAGTTREAIKVAVLR